VALFLLDTNHACRLLDPEDPLWTRLRAVLEVRFAIALATLGELVYMVEKSARRAENRQRLERLLDEILILPFSEAEARLSGELRAAAQRRGYNLTAVDTQIAAVAKFHEAVLLTTDSDFDALPDVPHENWLK
jgi:tRNA(fMet)-specific endonuclease VapC